MTTEASDIGTMDGEAGRAGGADGRRLSTWLRRRPSLRGAASAISAGIAAQTGRRFLWTPVAFGVGCAVYLTLRFEPPLWLCVAAAGAAIAAAVSMLRAFPGRLAAFASVMAALVICGVAAGSVRTQAVKGPIAPRTVGLLEGWVVDVASPGAGGGRLLIAPYRLDDLAPDELPRRVRITVGPDRLVGPGAAVRMVAIVNPPPGPASPGAYDFARDAFFKEVGGVAFALDDPVLVSGPEPPIGLRLRMAINEMRWTLALRIAERSGPKAAGMAAAMVTGHEAWIDKDTEQALRDSGLAHMISISGLHMALVGGFVFFFVRLSVAAWPWLALRAPGKKIAAATALGAILLYLVVSGAPAPAVRAAVTLGVAFVAVLLDRQAFTLRALAIAALLVLMMHPEAVAQPGFQMSFAATAALLALAEVWPRAPREIDVPWTIRLAQRAPRWAAAAFLASLVAGAATGPFAMQHFNRVATFGLPANMVTELLAAFVVMPSLALGAVLAAFDLPNPFLTIAAIGIERIIDTGAWFASRPHAVKMVASAPDAALPVAFLGVLWICLWKGRGRWLGLPAAFAVMLWPRPEPPAMWVAGDGGGAAVVREREAVSLRPDAKRFGYELWARRRGLGVQSKDARPAGFNCNRNRCLPGPDSPAPVAAWWTKRPPKPAELAAGCASAEIVISKARPAACVAPVVLSGEDFAAGGAAEIYRAPAGWRIVWANDSRGVRPWTLSDSGG